MVGNQKKHAARKARNQGKGKGQKQQAPSLYERPATQGWSGGSWSSSRGPWQAAASAWAASSWRGAKGAATVTRERATGVVVEVQPWTGSCRPDCLPTSQDLEGLIFLLACFSLPLVGCSFSFSSSLAQPIFSGVGDSTQRMPLNLQNASVNSMTCKDFTKKFSSLWRNTGSRRRIQANPPTEYQARRRVSFQVFIQKLSGVCSWQKRPHLVCAQCPL